MKIDHLSVSSVKLADKCTLAHHYHYVDRLPAPEEAATKIFGTVVHIGVEKWYGDSGTDNHRTTKLKNYIHDEWFHWLPQDVAIALRHCIAAENGLIGMEELIKITRPEIKAPRQTKDFLTSEEFKVFETARDELLAASAASEEMRWPQNENAYQAYQKSMYIGTALEKRWQFLPRPLIIEQQFNIEVAGIEIHGRIDQIRQDPDEQGEIKHEGVDIKTGKQMLTQMDAFLQAYLYNEACIQNQDLPIPEFWTFWMARHNKPQRGRIDPVRHGKLADRILTRVRKQIESDSYAPHFGMWCSSCDYRGMCEAEISMWPPGETSLVLESDVPTIGS